MNVTPTAARSTAPARSSARAWTAKPAARPAPIQSALTCGPCGLIVRSARSLPDHTALLLNVGWTEIAGRLACPECTAGVVRRVVTGSKGDRYVLRHVCGAWRCSCPGYSYRGHCTHADSLEVEMKERARLSVLAREFLAECEPAESVQPEAFLEWLGKDARKVTVEGCRLVLASVLERYRHVCRHCEGQGGETWIEGGMHEPLTGGRECPHCNGDGELDPPHLAPAVAEMPVAAE